MMNKLDLEPKTQVWELPDRLAEDAERLIRSTVHQLDPWRTRNSCVDGRGCNIANTVQTLGGVYGTIPIIRFTHWLRGEKIGYTEAFDLNLQLLTEAGFDIGFHDSPEGPADIDQLRQNSVLATEPDCGFAKKFGLIIASIATYPNELKALLNHGAQQNGLPLFIDNKTAELWEQLSQTAQAIVAAAAKDEKHRFLSASKLFGRAIGLAGSRAITHVTVPRHIETAAHVNLIDGYSLDQNDLNQRGTQAFNLDLWYIRRQLRSEPFKRIGVDSRVGDLLTLAEYQATERVLRPDKTPLPILITHSLEQLEAA